jgi:uncharacterized protein YoxC
MSTPKSNSNSMTGVDPVTGIQAESVPESVTILPSGWQLYEDDNGIPYYHHAATGQSSWEPPSSGPQASPSDCESDSDSQSVRLSDHSSSMAAESDSQTMAAHAMVGAGPGEVEMDDVCELKGALTMSSSSSSTNCNSGEQLRVQTSPTFSTQPTFGYNTGSRYASGECALGSGENADDRRRRAPRFHDGGCSGRIAEWHDSWLQFKKRRPYLRHTLWFVFSVVLPIIKIIWAIYLSTIVATYYSEIRVLRSEVADMQQATKNVETTLSAEIEPSVAAALSTTASLNSTMTSLESQVSRSAGTVSILSATVGQVEALTSSLRSELNVTSNFVSSLNSTVDSVSTEVALAAKATSQVTDTVAVLKSDLNSTASIMSSLNSTVNKVQTLTAILRTDMESAVDSVQNVSASVTSLSSEVGHTASSLSLLRQFMEGVQSNLTNTTQNLERVQNTTYSLSTAILQTSTSLDSMQFTISGLDDRLNSAGTASTVLQGRVDVLTHDVQELDDFFQSVEELNSTVQTISTQVTFMQSDIVTWNTSVHHAQRNVHTSLSDFSALLQATSSTTISDINTAKDTAVTSSNNAISTVNTAKDSAISQVNTAKDAAVTSSNSAVTAVNNAKNTAISQVNTAKNAAIASSESIVSTAVTQARNDSPQRLQLETRECSGTLNCDCPKSGQRIIHGGANCYPSGTRSSYGYQFLWYNFQRDSNTWTARCIGAGQLEGAATYAHIKITCGKVV